MMTVFKYLWSSYGKVYAWFWAIIAVIVLGLSASYEIFGHYTLDDERVSVWETVGSQGPRWFLFAMGIMMVTVSLPAAVAHGVTRRTFYRGALLFAVVSAALFALLSLGGYGVEYATYHFNGMLAEMTKPYPLAGADALTRNVIHSFLSEFGFMVTAWVIGLLYYRLNVWLALLLTPVAAVPLLGGLPPTMMSWWNAALQALALVVGAIVAFAMVRSVPLRTRKA